MLTKASTSPAMAAPKTSPGPASPTQASVPVTSTIPSSSDVLMTTSSIVRRCGVRKTSSTCATVGVRFSDGALPKTGLLDSTVTPPDDPDDSLNAGPGRIVPPVGVEPTLTRFLRPRSLPVGLQGRGATPYAGGPRWVVCPFFPPGLQPSGPPTL